MILVPQNILQPSKFSYKFHPSYIFSIHHQKLSICQLKRKTLKNFLSSLQHSLSSAHFYQHWHYLKAIERDRKLKICEKGFFCASCATLTLKQMEIGRAQGDYGEEVLERIVEGLWGCQRKVLGKIVNYSKFYRK